MYDELFRRIDSQEVWTFRDCLGLASDMNMKTRIVIAMVHQRGKRYQDTETVNEIAPDQ